MTRPILIVPGLNGSSGDHWQNHWLADHDEANLVAQADWSNPQEAQWLDRLELAIRANPGALIVAHSLGVILTARLSRSPVAALVGGALLVAPADIERTSRLHARTYEFGVLPRDPLPFPALMVASRDDVYMSLEKAMVLAGDWGIPVVDLGHVGHINVASGFGRWPAGYALAQGVIERAERRSQRPAAPQAIVGQL